MTKTSAKNDGVISITITINSYLYLNGLPLSLPDW